MGSSTESSPSAAEFRQQFLAIADAIRATATSGLYWTRELPYEQERYHLILKAAADLVALIDARPAAEIHRSFLGELGHQTPKLAVGGIAFDSRDRILLIQRLDNSLWAIPGGFAEVGQTLRQSVEREIREETGLIAKSRELLGLYDSRRTTRTPQHTVNAVFTCELLGGILTPSYETPAVAFFAEADLPPLSQGHEVWVKAAFRRRSGSATSLVID